MAIPAPTQPEKLLFSGPFDPEENSGEQAPFVPDTEWAIRQAFQTSVRTGYELLFRRYYQPMCSQAVRFVYSREVAQDIVAEVFLNFWKNGVHGQISTSYRAYGLRWPIKKP